MKEEYTEEELRKAHDENGYCASCGWHALFSEHYYTKMDNPNIDEYWDFCQNSDYPDEAHSHRGCFIYPKQP